jgi:glycosyltransferase involved in cell wall biosynthesis
VYLHQLLASNELGGAGLIALNLADFFRTQFQECHVWIPGDGSAKRKANELGLSHHLYNPANVLSSSKVRAAVGNWRIGRALHRHSPGIVHFYSPFYYGALCQGVKISGLKNIVHIQLEEGREGLSWAFKSPPDLIITCANFLVEHIRSALPGYLQESQRIVSVPNAVDTKRFSPSDKVLAKRYVGAPDGIPLVLMVANLAPHKGQETVIRAAVALKEMGIGAHFWLAGIERGGKQEYTSRLRSLCCEFGVADRVHFLGQRENIPDLLRAADFFLLPSTSEGLPLSVLEAQATKVPVLAAPTAGIPEVVTDWKTGFLIPAGDVGGYANRIKTLLLNSSLYHCVTEQAYAMVAKEHSWRAFCGKIEELYQSLIDVDLRYFSSLV